MRAGWRTSGSRAHCSACCRAVTDSRRWLDALELGELPPADADFGDAELADGGAVLVPIRREHPRRKAGAGELRLHRFGQRERKLAEDRAHGRGESGGIHGREMGAGAGIEPAASEL